MIDWFRELATHNGEVHGKLMNVLGENESVGKLKAREQSLRDQIVKANNFFRLDLSTLLQDERKNYDVDPGDPFSNPKAQALKEKHDKTIAEITPLLQATQNKLAQGNSIVQDYEPSGLPKESDQKGNFNAAITRDKVAGMVG